MDSPTGEASGYEIKKGIEDGMFSHFIDASFGSIYPALTQLAGEGLLTVRAEEQSGKPDKKVYAITRKWSQGPCTGNFRAAREDKYKSEFLFQMLLQQYITPDVMLAAIDKQLADLRGRSGAYCASAGVRSSPMRVRASWPIMARRC